MQGVIQFKSRVKAPLRKELLHTNYVPTSCQALQIRAYIKHSLQRLSYLDERLARLHNEIDRLTLERSRIPHRIELFRATLSPMRKLPVELIQDIFIRCLPTDRNAIMAATEAPLLLGRVCSSWRSISRATPELWTSLHVADVHAPLLQRLYGEQRWRQAMRNVVKGWLERSGDRPLSISLVEKGQWKMPLANTIMMFSKRWKKIDLTLADWPSSAIARLSPRDVPNLESISLRDLAGKLSDHWTSAGIFHAPRLRRIHVYESHAQGTPLHPRQLRWTQLTELHVYNSRGAPREFLEILRVARNLLDCVISFNDVYNHAHSHPSAYEGLEPVSHLTLRRFSLRGKKDVSLFLQNLYAPALDFFEFSVPTLLTLPLALRTFLSNCSSTLKALTVDTRFLSPQQLRGCFEQTPGLTRLDIRSYEPTSARGALRSLITPPPLPFPFDDAAFERHIPNDIAPHMCLCPLLEEFYCDQPQFSDASVRDFILARTRPKAETGKRTSRNKGVLKRFEVRFGRNREIDLERGPLAALTLDDDIKILLQYKSC
ncbi:hypothetical protein DXG03_004402 [Asterophora parasitica]|uniref:F-box domain-containing protein n=1 Tax=Asterophora parasitica TaxID=117018 RepID=A0A9P7KAA0_9AGAR|nr:hypothetical protein DXG03_004402 [Asterophora parasitica]